MKKLASFVFVIEILAGLLFAGDFKEFKLSNGIPVYYKKNTVNPIDSVSIVVKGGVRYYEKENSGIEAALFTMMTKGSKLYSSEDLKALKYETSASFSSITDYEGSWLSLTTIDDYLEDTLPVFIDGFMNPAYEAAEYTKLMTAYREKIQSMLNEPESMALYYAKQFIFQNHTYGTSIDVSPESLNSITIPALKNHHAKLMDSRRIAVVAVTVKEPEEYISLLEEGLGKIKAASWELEAADVEPVVVKKRPLVLTHSAAEGTGYYYRAFSAPSVKSDEYIPFMVAKGIYNQTMHNVLRVKYGMCYTAGNSDLGVIPNVNLEILYRCNDMTDIKNRVAEARNITADGKYILDVDQSGNYVFANIADDFEGFKNSEVNSMYGSYLTSSGLNRLVSESILLWNDSYSFENHLNKIQDVTCEQVLEVFRKYYLTDNEFWFACVAPAVEEQTEAILKK